MDLIIAILAVFPEGFSLLRGSLLSSLGWICLAVVLIGGSMISLAYAQTRNGRHTPADISSCEEK